MAAAVQWQRLFFYHYILWNFFIYFLYNYIQTQFLVVQYLVKYGSVAIMGDSIMKKTKMHISILLVISVLLIAVSCSSGTPDDAAGPFFGHIGKLEFGEVSALTDNTQYFGRSSEMLNKAGDYEKGTLKEIFGCIKAEIHPEEKGDGQTVPAVSDTKTVTVTLSVPDFAYIISYASSESASGMRSKYEVIDAFLDSGMLSQHMITNDVTVTEIKTENGYIIPFGPADNGEIYDMLKINQFISWFLG